MKTFLKVLAGIFAIIVILGGIGFYFITKDIEKGKTVVINSVNLSALEDGEYNGKYSFSRWQSEVNVTVKDNKILAIKLLSPPGTPDVSKKLFDTIIREQKVDIDVVSGATVTSKAYLKAVENALNKKGE